MILIVYVVYWWHMEFLHNTHVSGLWKVSFWGPYLKSLILICVRSRPLKFNLRCPIIRGHFLCCWFRLYFVLREVIFVAWSPIKWNLGSLISHLWNRLWLNSRRLNKMRFVRSYSFKFDIWSINLRWGRSILWSKNVIFLWILCCLDGIGLKLIFVGALPNERHLIQNFTLN